MQRKLLVLYTEFTFFFTVIISAATLSTFTLYVQVVYGSNHRQAAVSHKATVLYKLLFFMVDVQDGEEHLMRMKRTLLIKLICVSKVVRSRGGKSH